jgi:hypothetical protein
MYAVCTITDHNKQKSAVAEPTAAEAEPTATAHTASQTAGSFFFSPFPSSFIFHLRARAASDAASSASIESSPTVTDDTSLDPKLCNSSATYLLNIQSFF